VRSLAGCTTEFTGMNPPTVGVLSTLADYEPRQLVSDLFHALSQPPPILCCSLEFTLQQTFTLEQYRASVSLWRRPSKALRLRP
jgi:hypothetical protein